MKNAIRDHDEEQQIDRLMARIPDPNVRNRFTKLSKDMDGLGRIDPRTQELVLDEKALRRMLRETFPAGFENEFIGRLKQLPDGGMIRDLSAIPHGTITSIRWKELVQRASVGKQGPSDPAPALDLDSPTLTDDFLQEVHRRLPGLPDSLFKIETLSRLAPRGIERMVSSSGSAEAAARTPQDVNDMWDCVLRNVGLWGAVGVIVFFMALIGGIIAAITATGGTAAAAAAALAAAFPTILANAMAAGFGVWGAGALLSSIACFFSFLLSQFGG